jgi:uncharacterized protein YaiI (UPF0178 family)
MQIWVDADACPKAIKDILFRAAERTRITTVLVANQYLQTPPSHYIKSMLVKSGYDMADNEIVKRLNVGDLVITGDIPLAYDFLSNPRGNDEGWSGQRYSHYMQFDTSKLFLEDAGFEVIDYYYRPLGNPTMSNPG